MAFTALFMPINAHNNGMSGSAPDKSKISDFELTLFSRKEYVTVAAN